jgi:hypothetical protein
MQGGLPADPGFTVRIYHTAANGCPDGEPLFVADCDVVAVGPGAGDLFDPIEYYCDFSENGFIDFLKVDGIEYSISIQNTNCPGEGTGAYWAYGTGDGVYGCVLAPDFEFPEWTSKSDAGYPWDFAMYLCNESPSSAVGATAGARPRVMLGRPIPNPATRALTYSIDLRDRSRVTVNIFTVSGCLVTHCIDQVLPAGRHAFACAPTDDQGRDLPTGVYYLNLDAAGRRETRQFVVLR